MTTIAARRDDGVITFAADQLITTKIRLASSPMRKLIRSSRWVVGAAGPVSCCQVVSAFLAERLLTVHSLAELRVLIQAMYHDLVSFGVRPEHDAGPVTEIPMQLLLGGPIGLFLVSEDRAIIPIEPGGYWAIGSGADYALGALAAGATTAGAVVAAMRFDFGTGGDIDEEITAVSNITL